MSLEIHSFVLGPLENNTYLLADAETGSAVIVDPAMGVQGILPQIQAQGWMLQAVWLTHAHFDHTTGIAALFNALGRTLPVGLHPADLDLYLQGGGAAGFGFHHRPGPQPSIQFAHADQLSVGNEILEVRHTPGHTPGHVIFYSSAAQSVLVGDVIFAGGVGRTDLPGGSWRQLRKSILDQVFTLPPETRIFSGHGKETSVGVEQDTNPFF